MEINDIKTTQIYAELAKEGLYPKNNKSRARLDGKWHAKFNIL